MLERKQVFVGILTALLALNLYSGNAQSATATEKEEARMWGGFRDKLSCTVDGSSVAANEKVVVREVIVPVYERPFIFIWDDWYHWSRWHHHPRIWHRPPAPPRPAIGRPPMHRPPRPHIAKPAPRPPRPAIGKPALKQGRPSVVKPNRSEMRPAPKARPSVRSAPRSRDDQMIFQNREPRGGGSRHHGGRPPRRR